MAKFDQKKIADALSSLKNLPQTKEIRSAIKRLQTEYNKLKPKTEQSVVTIPKEQIREQANQRRSSFAKGAWRVADLAWRFPEVQKKFKGKKEVYIDFFKRRRGEQSDISDAIWQNLSSPQ